MAKEEYSTRSEYTAANRVLFRGPCKFLDVICAGDGANADCQIYDGVNANGELKAHIESLSGTTFGWMPPHHIHFFHGIYVVVNASTTKVTVTFEPHSRHESV